jgi:hypothetical protein
MGGGGKGGSTTVNKTEIPPEVLARYNAVNARAETVAQQPYQKYSNDPNAFVAGLTPTQTAGIQNTNAMAGAAQPYYGAATEQLMQAQQGAQPAMNAAYQNLDYARGQGQQYLGAATQNVGQAQGQGQQYLGAATAAGLAGAQGINPNALDVNQYMNPYTQNVVNATQAAMNQQQGQQLSQQQGEAIRAGAFGGQRAGLQRAALQGQQSLAQAQAISPLYQQNYQQALAAAQQQQGVGLGAAQANRAAVQNYAQQLGNLGQQGYQQGMGAAQQYGALGQQGYQQGVGTSQQLGNLAQQGYNMGAGTSAALAQLGTNAQQAGLAGAQAQLQAGQQQQQTEQAGKQAMYNQFMQEQGYPFQVAQFLANIATGTGALSGNQSTSTTTGGGGFFSDKRLKENVQKVGETNDGQPIYRYNYKGDKRTQIGLLAQDVEKEHPEAVGLAGGYKTVDYKKATDRSVRKADGGGMTDAYSMDAPSQMLGRPSGLGALQLPQMRTEGIAVRSMTPASEIEALRAPKSTGFSPGTMEAARAERSSLASAPNNGIGSGPAYVADRMTELDKFLAANASQGGLVGPQGGNFARGGFAFGGGSGPYGVQLDPMQQRQMMQGMQAAAPQQRNGLAEAKQIGDLAVMGYSGYKNRPDFLRSAADVEARKQTEAASKVAELQKLAWAKENGIDVDALLARASGGAIGDREAYRGQGYVNAGSNPYGGGGGYLDDTLQTQQETPRPSLDVKGAPKPPPAKSGLGELVQAGSAAQSAYKGGEKLLQGGKWAADKLGLGAPTAMSATSTGASAMPGVIDLTSGAGLAGAAPEAAAAAVPEALAGAAAVPEALAGSAAAAEGLAGATAAAEGAGLLGSLGTGAAAVGTGIMEALPFLAFLSDERAKHDIKKVGELYDGQPVYRYAYNGDDRTQIGLLAQKVEKDHPEAVGLAGGMKTVDYKKATDDAAKRRHFDGTDGSFVDPETVPADGGGDGESTRGDRITVVPKSMPEPARPPAPVDAAISRAREAQAAPSKPFFPEITSKGVKDTLSSENFWVPALAGLGSMLASPNKTLAGAIGSGLVGGTGAYTGMQKQTADIAKQRIDALKSRFVGPTLINGQMMYRDTWNGDNISQQEYSARVSQHITGKTPGAASPAAVATAREVVAEGSPEVARPAATGAARATAKPEPGATAAAGATPAAGSTPPAAAPSSAPTATTGTVSAPGANLIQMDQAMLDNEDLWKALPPPMRPKALLNDAAAMDEKIRRLEANRATIEQTVGETDQSKAITSEIASLRTDREAKIARAQQQMTRATKLQEEAASAEIKRKSEVQQETDIIELLPRKQQLELQGELGRRGAIDPVDLKQKQAEADIARDREIRTAREKLPIEEEKVAFDANVKRQNDALQAAAKEAKDAQVAKGQAVAALSVMFDKNGKPMISTGPLGPKIAGVAAYMSQLGFSDGFIKDFTSTSPSNAQALAKLQTAMAAEIARLEFAGAPVRQTEFLQFLETTPSATLLPEAFKWIVENTILPKANSSINAYKKVKDFTPGIGEGKNIQGQLFDYYEENPWFKVGETRLGEEPAVRTSNRPPVPQLSDDQKAALAEEIRARRAAKGTR